MSYSPGTGLHRVLIEAVDDERTWVLDYYGNNEFSVTTNAPGGVLPRPGDLWAVDRKSGSWELTHCLSLAPPQRVGTMAGVLRSLTDRGLVDVDFEGHDPPLSIHGTAFVSECRLFSTGHVPEGYLLCNGATYPVPRWRRLFRVLGIDTVPNIPTGVAAVQWWICAE